MKIVKISILSLAHLSFNAFGQNTPDWEFSSALNAMRGSYDQSLAMNNQHGTGLRLWTEHQKSWGLSAGLQTTHINMNALSPSPTQNQDNWLVSAFTHSNSTFQPGRWTLRLDHHRINNDTQAGNSDGVRVIAPQISWVSQVHPITFDLSYAHSSYKDTPAVKQIGLALGLGISTSNWLQLRSYNFRNLDPNYAMGHHSTQASELKLTHFMQSTGVAIPTAVTIGIERGQKIFHVDMLTQTVYNLPMVNEGATSIAARWDLGKNTKLSLQLSKTRYLSTATPYSPLPDHHFTLQTLSTEIATTW
jgi:hypothetical protein